MTFTAFLNGGGLDRLLLTAGVDYATIDRLAKRIGNEQFARVTVTIEADQLYRVQMPYDGRRHESIASWPYWDGKR